MIKTNLYHREGQFAKRAVALQGALAHIQHSAQVGVIQQSFTIGHQRPVLRRIGLVQPFDGVDLILQLPEIH